MKPAQFVLAALALCTVVGFVGTQATADVFESTGLVRGWDFQQFYVAGRVVGAGQGGRLYDVEAFQSAQQSLLPVDEQNIPFFPLYPPMIAVVVAPLAKLSYLPALGIWAAVNVACYAFACRLLWPLVGRRYRWTAALAMVGFFPLFIALRAGQMTPILLLFLVVGLRYRSGLALSLLAWKPQLACGIFLYFALRRRWHICGGMILGGLGQALLIAVILGPRVLLDYLSFAAIYAQHGQMYVFPHGWVHSLAGTTSLGLHLTVVVAIALLLFTLPKTIWRRECALAVCFMLLLTPHLLLYDLTSLVVPAVFMLRFDWKMSAALLAASSAIVMPLYTATNLSFVPVLLVTCTLLMAWRVTQKRRAKGLVDWRDGIWLSVNGWICRRRKASAA